VATGGQRIRVNVRWGTGVPLVLCNGIGASLEVLDPLVEQLDSDTTVVRFDVPGTGGSPTSLAPYGFPYLAWVLGGYCPSWESAWWTYSGCPGAARLRNSSPFRTRAGAAA
jgi:pimeloyl-ACP methyl ester carboxylesterase